MDIILLRMLAITIPVAGAMFLLYWFVDCMMERKWQSPWRMIFNAISWMWEKKK